MFRETVQHGRDKEKAHRPGSLGPHYVTLQNSKALPDQEIKKEREWRKERRGEKGEEEEGEEIVMGNEGREKSREEQKDEGK